MNPNLEAPHSTMKQARYSLRFRVCASRFRESLGFRAASCAKSEVGLVAVRKLQLIGWHPGGRFYKRYSATDVT